MPTERRYGWRPREAAAASAPGLFSDVFLCTNGVMCRVLAPQRLHVGANAADSINLGGNAFYGFG